MFELGLVLIKWWYNNICVRLLAFFRYRSVEIQNNGRPILQATLWSETHLKIVVFCVMTQCRLVEVCQSFRESAETSEYFHQSSRRHCPQDTSSCSHCCGNLKSHWHSTTYILYMLANMKRFQPLLTLRNTKFFSVTFKSEVCSLQKTTPHFHYKDQLVNSS